MNPYRRKSGIVPGVTKFHGQSNPIANNAGQINASSIKDIVEVVANLMNQKYTPDTEELTASRQEKAAVLRAAMGDSSQLRMLGETIAQEIFDTTEREGFVRKVMDFKTISKGDTLKITPKTRDVVAYTATSPSQVIPYEVRNNYITPDEFVIQAMVLIDLKENAIDENDTLGEKLDEGLEAFMVKEDNLWLSMAKTAAVAKNTQQNFTTFSPDVLNRLMFQVSQWGLPVNTCILDTSLWMDLLGSRNFPDFNPVSQLELLETGRLGNLFGVELISDFKRQPERKVLSSGEILVVSAPINHGVMTVRDGILSEPVDQFPLGIAKKGWFLHQITSMTVVNPQSVAYGVRV